MNYIRITHELLYQREFDLSITKYLFCNKIYSGIIFLLPENQKCNIIIYYNTILCPKLTQG